MTVRWASLVAGILVGGVSLAATAWTASARVAEVRAPAVLGSPLVPVPAALLPAGTPRQPARPPLTGAQRRLLAVALWRSPLNQPLVDYLYVDAVQSGRSPATIARAARLLAATGWRYTPAQQNLLMRAAIDGRFADTIDRAEGLLRRQKLTAVAIAMMSAMEAIPQTRPLIVRKLEANPGWRPAYLGSIKPETAPAVLTARVATTAALLRTPAGVTRYELGGLLTALVANGRAREAYALWRQQAGPDRSGNLASDGDFATATRRLGQSDVQYPFEWSLGQDIGYSTQLSPGAGVAISWDGRGAPVFLSQRVPIRPGQGYALRIDGRVEEQGTIATTLAPMLTCGNASVMFDLVAGDRSSARYAVAALPRACDMATLTIGGSVDSGTGNRTIVVQRVTLTPLR